MLLSRSTTPLSLKSPVRSDRNDKKWKPQFHKSGAALTSVGSWCYLLTVITQVWPPVNKSSAAPGVSLNQIRSRVCRNFTELYSPVTDWADGGCAHWLAHVCDPSDGLCPLSPVPPCHCHSLCHCLHNSASLPRLTLSHSTHGARASPGAGCPADPGPHMGPTYTHYTHHITNEWKVQQHTVTPLRCIHIFLPALCLQSVATPLVAGRPLLKVSELMSSQKKTNECRHILICKGMPGLGHVVSVCEFQLLDHSNRILWVAIILTSSWLSP